MKDWILLILACTTLFDGLTNLVLVRTVRRHLKATSDLTQLIVNPVRIRRREP